MVELQNTEFFSSRQKNVVLASQNVITNVLKQLHTPFFPLCQGFRCIDALQGLEDIDAYHRVWFEHPRSIRRGARAIATIVVQLLPTSNGTRYRSNFLV